MNKISALWQLFKVGQSVSDPSKWKSRQITVTVLGAALLAVVNLLAAFGMSIPVDTETANAIAGGFLAIANVILTLTTTDKIGVNNNLKLETKKEEPKDETKETKTGIPIFDGIYGP
jgi:uncharacterized membrane protein